eukprot:CAMPEP_0197180118 /NCGR_PEP_ID=MMETSP1423-20130617/4835_1 /TAXON_ID=476441 /ORGANISM="Pseudo-nitzschia heimii, Strain UNC1101" /LENGTH=528 /DNA_ID=CAMNT_0042630139 /DNA_START=60 /DNA_END=1646 /DNA_ORIENTATION=-
MLSQECNEKNQHHGEQPQRLDCDYLVVGAGTSGMSFVDTILTQDPKATLILVDRNERPGGHWVHVYPFCKLHQTSCNYGVNSTTLGRSLNRKGKERYDIHDRSTGQDVVDYYQRVREKFEATGRVSCFFGAEYKRFDADGGGFHVIAADGGNAVLEVRCRRRLVTVENNVLVPSMREPTIPVHEGASFVPVNALPESMRSGRFQNYVVFGCGKTGADAIVHLLRNGVDQSQITWVVSRDVWYFLRDAMEDFHTVNDILLDPFLKSASSRDIFLEWEKQGLVGRLDRSTIPGKFKGATMDVGELELMRSVEAAVRKGRAVAVERDTIVLERGSIGYDPDTTLLVDCMVDGSYGYDLPNDFRVFEPGRIKMGPMTFFFNASFSAAHIAFLECALDNDDAKNDSCYFVRGKTPDEVSSPENVIANFYMQMKSTEKLTKIKGGTKFMMKSRTNINAPKHHKGGMVRILWHTFGPSQWMKKGKTFEKKVESKKFKDVDYRFYDDLASSGSSGEKKEGKAPEDIANDQSVGLVA